MYNFLDYKLSPKVTSTSPTTDNYEVTNLISGNLLAKSRGCLAYSTVKPPMSITFELICPINVHYIALWTTVGAQKCTAIEISTKNSHIDFTPIAYAKFNSSGIVFCNSRMYSAGNPPPRIDASFHLSFFRHSTFRSFTTANLIKVSILKTERSVPCLGKVEIWGRPSKVCSLITVNTINRLMQVPVTVTTVSSPVPKIETDMNDWEIPDEFKDALTYDVMAIPITLPSGNTVDQSTVEKFVANEASYGRGPSDPFTGQSFTDSRKPVFNASLKSRIDMFLLQNSHRSETFNFKRTLGKTSDVSVDENRKVGVKRNAIEVMEKCNKILLREVAGVMVGGKSGDDDKLNEAIRKTMNSSSFICFTSEKKDDTSGVDGCVQCRSKNNLYIIPCRHLYCRNCLLEICKNLKCELCASPFDKSDPKKFHLNV